MKTKTSELTDAALAYAAACAEGMSFPALKHVQYPDDAPWVLHPNGTILSAEEVPSNTMSRHYVYTFWAPQEDWSQGGPIIEREGISLQINMDGDWHATKWVGRLISARHNVQRPTKSYPLVAAMRCFVASKLGDEVDVPQELLK